MILHVRPDKQKANSLIKMAKTSLERLNELDILKYPSHSLTDYYDIIHKLLDALTSLEGIKFKGDGAHQELINYACKKLNLSESIRLFLQELRDYKNRVSYEGFFINPNYIKQNEARIKSIVKELINATN